MAQSNFVLNSNLNVFDRIEAYQNAYNLAYMAANEGNIEGFIAIQTFIFNNLDKFSVDAVADKKQLREWKIDLEQRMVFEAECMSDRPW